MELFSLLDKIATSPKGCAKAIHLNGVPSVVVAQRSAIRKRGPCTVNSLLCFGNPRDRQGDIVGCGQAVPRQVTENMLIASEVDRSGTFPIKLHENANLLNYASLLGVFTGLIRWIRGRSKDA